MNYPYIRAWGAMLRSLPRYIEQQVERATHEAAPERAIYRQDDGTWATVDQVHPSTQAALETRVAAQGGA